MKEDLDRHDTRGAMIPEEGVSVVFFDFIHLRACMINLKGHRHRAMVRGMKTEFGSIRRLVGLIERETLGWD
jgi:hypothetical protein